MVSVVVTSLYAPALPQPLRFNTPSARCGPRFKRFSIASISSFLVRPPLFEIDLSYSLVQDFRWSWHLYTVSGDDDGTITYNPPRSRLGFLVAGASGYANLNCGRLSVFVHGVEVATGSRHDCVFTACNAHALHLAVCLALVVWGKKLF